MCNKDRVKELLLEMTSDSKSKSFKAEKELCGILTAVIKRLHAIERATDSYQRSYPYNDRIDSIEHPGVWDTLPKIIECDEGDFDFYTEWLDWTDQDFKNYFETLRAKRISGIKQTVENVKFSLNKHLDNIKKLESLDFSDVAYE